MIIDYSYILSLPNFFYGLGKKKFTKEGLMLNKDGCIKSKLIIEENIVDDLKKALIPEIKKSKSLNKDRIHINKCLRKKHILMLKKSNSWEEIVKIASYGLKRNAFLKQGTVEYLDSPSKALEYGAQRWHHDNKGNQVKCMILLTDNNPNGQVTSYITKSHQVMRLRYDRFSRYKNEDIKNFSAKGVKVDLYGKKGEIYFINTNGAHRGNCRPKADPRILVSLNFLPRFAREVKNELLY